MKIYLSLILNMATVKCKHSKCKHESKDIDKSVAVKSGNAYYHVDCLKDKENRKEIVDLFVKNINANVVFAQLQAVIRTILDDKGNSSDFLLFGLKYYIEHKIPLNYPQGLYYVIQNKEMIAEYNKIKDRQIIAKENFVIPERIDEVEFTYKPTKTKGFADILGG